MLPEFKHVIIVTITGGLAVLGLLMVGMSLEATGGAAFFGVVFFAGTLGASTNNYRRLLKLHTAPDGRFHPRLESDVDTDVQRLIIAQIYMSAVIGGMFGLLLLVVFVSGLVQGSLFPAFVTKGEGLQFWWNPDGAMARIRATYVASASDAAKVIVWSFVAGFSENFVPNILDRLATAGEKQATDRFEATDEVEATGPGEPAE